jgi:hypothetical protein
MAPRVTLPKHFSTMKRPVYWLLVSLLVPAAILLAADKADTPEGRIFILLLAGAAIIISVPALFPARTGMSVDEHGITLHRLFWRRHLRWEHLRSFSVVDFDDTGLGLTPAWARYGIGYQVHDEQQLKLPKLLVRFHRAYGCHGSLPPVDGMHAEDLAKLLNGALKDYHRRAAEE